MVFTINDYMNETILQSTEEDDNLKSGKFRNLITWTLRGDENKSPVSHGSRANEKLSYKPEQMEVKETKYQAGKEYFVIDDPQPIESGLTMKSSHKTSVYLKKLIIFQIAPQ